MKDKTYQKAIKKFLGNFGQIDAMSYHCIIGIAKGGIIPATYLSYWLNLPLYTINSVSYVNKQKFPPVVFVPKHIQAFILRKKIILIDDLIDTGDTILQAVKRLRSGGPSEINVVTVFRKKSSPIVGKSIITLKDKWVEFPYEKTY